MTQDEYAEFELDGCMACLKALQSLPDAQKSKLRGFIIACRSRGLMLAADEKQRIYLERLDGEPITGDISDLFTWIYGFSECALLVYLGSKYRCFGDNLKVIARRFGCDLFTAACLAMGMKRDLYLASCEDWNLKPKHVPPEFKKPAKFKPAVSNTKLRVFEVKNQRGESFKFQVSCIDEALPDALRGLRVIRELTAKNKTGGN